MNQVDRCTNWTLTWLDAHGMPRRAPFTVSTFNPNLPADCQDAGNEPFRSEGDDYDVD